MRFLQINRTKITIVMSNIAIRVPVAPATADNFDASSPPFVERQFEEELSANNMIYTCKAQYF